MELKGSKTETNLMAAFAGESEARNKYTYYASKARKEGYEQIADLFVDPVDLLLIHVARSFSQVSGRCRSNTRSMVSI